MLESTIQGKFIKKVKELKLGLAMKIDSTSRRGCPDILFVSTAGAISLIEFKGSGGRLSPHQVTLHNDLIRLGADVRVISSMEEVDAFIATLAG
jgi:hypothetical protein